MIRVVIDTNSLPRNPSSPSAAHKRTISLIEEGVLQVLMPHVVAEEWRTQQLEHLRKQLQKAGEALKDILGSGHMEGHNGQAALNAAATAIVQTAPDIDAISHQALQRLLDDLQTQIIPMANEHGARVTAAYFKGSPPFSSAKSRKDFPDALIFEAIADLTGTDPARHLVVVTADQNFAKHLSTLPGCTCVATLEALVESDPVKQLAGGIALEAKWRQAMPAIVAAVRDHEDDLFTSSFVNSFVNKLASLTAKHPSIPSDNNDAIVSMVDDPENIEIDWNNVEDYGPGLLRVPFTCTSEVLLDFLIYHADAFHQPDCIKVQLADYEATPFFDAQAYATAEVAGFIAIELHDWLEEIDPATIEAAVDEITQLELKEDDAGRALV